MILIYWISQDVDFDVAEAIGNRYCREIGWDFVQVIQEIPRNIMREHFVCILSNIILKIFVIVQKILLEGEM